MAKLDTIVIGASAGGVETLGNLVSLLPADLPAAILIVIHFPESSTSVLPSILARRGPIPAHHAMHGERIRPGEIYIAPSGRHMLVYDGQIHLTTGPRENGNRPAIDPLFRSAARSRGARVMSVVLSGLLDDGSLGTAAIKNHGGVTFAQDPDEALFGDMPRNAIQLVGTDYVLPLAQLAEKIRNLAGAEVPESAPTLTVDPVEMNTAELEDLETHGRPSVYVCPECQGTLFEIAEEGVRHYRCRVGHSYLADSLATSQENAVEMALWSALRALKEHTSLLRQMLRHAEQKGYRHMATTYRQRLAEASQRLSAIEQVVDASQIEGYLPPSHGLIPPASHKVK